MGVIGYRSLLIKKHKNCMIQIKNEYDYVFIDGNCTLHEKFVNDIDYFSQFPIILKKFIELFEKFKSKNYYIIFDGQAPLNKQVTQKRRRENNFDESSLFLPGLYLLIELEIYLIEHFKNYSDVNNINININSSDNVGEGEQKIFLILNELILSNENLQNIMMISLDTDVIILSQLTLLKYNMLNIDIFIHTIEDTYNIKTDLIFNANLLNKLMFKGNLNKNNLLLFAFLCGNDFVSKNTTLDTFKTATELYSNFISRNVTKLSDLSYKCVNNCDKLTLKNIKIYVNLFNWYKEYFLTNKFISCCPYEIKKTPCGHCLNLYIDTDLVLIKPPKDYHKGILSKPVYNALCLKNEITRLNNIEI